MDFILSATFADTDLIATIKSTSQGATPCRVTTVKMGDIKPKIGINVTPEDATQG